MTPKKEGPERKSVRPVKMDCIAARSGSPNTKNRRANQYAANRQRAETERRLRLRQLARQIHPLGSRVFFELVLELDAGASLDDVLERYGRISKYASFIRDMGGADLEPQFHAIAGGRP